MLTDHGLSMTLTLPSKLTKPIGELADRERISLSAAIRKLLLAALAHETGEAPNPAPRS
jgi:hypothetical protein